METTRREFLKGLAIAATIYAGLPKDALAQTVTEPVVVPTPSSFKIPSNFAVKTRALKTTMSIELAEDLKCVHGIAVETELKSILVEEIEREIGPNARGTIRPVRMIDPYTFEPKIRFMFYEHDGNHSRADNWNMDLEDVFGKDRWIPSSIDKRANEAT